MYLLYLEVEPGSTMRLADGGARRLPEKSVISVGEDPNMTPICSHGLVMRATQIIRIPEVGNPHWVVYNTNRLDRKADLNKVEFSQMTLDLLSAVPLSGGLVLGNRAHYYLPTKTQSSHQQYPIKDKE